MRNLQFTKISATGNDFITIDNRARGLSEADANFFRLICMRRRSVGADGVLLINDSDEFDFELRYFNADGSEAQCGNGARAAAYFASKREICGPACRFKFEDSIYQARVSCSSVRLTFPKPHSLEKQPGIVQESQFREAGYINTGVPHYVLFTDDLEGLAVIELGRKYRHHSHFGPKGTNVNFVQITGKDHLAIRTFERGVEDETLACGTGIVAATILSKMDGTIGLPVEVHTQGGVVTVDLGEDGVPNLTGDVTEIYQAVLTVSEND